MNQTITLDYIQNEVAKYFNIPVESLQKDSNKQEIVKPRQICMWFAREFKVDSDTKIGKRLADRDRTSVISAWNKVNDFIETDGKYASEIKYLNERFKDFGQIELWKDIPGYEGFYKASTFGRIKSLDNKIQMKDGRTYDFKGRIIKYSRAINMYKDGRNTKKSYLRLLAVTFIPNPLKLAYVLKIDPSKGNHITNIKWHHAKKQA
jgi:hypothetical protein